MDISIVAATTLSEAEFWSISALGQSLDRFSMRGAPSIFIHYLNNKGLPEIYNQHLTESAPCGAIVFVHDDVWLDDFYLFDRIRDGLRNFDVIGVAGNRRRLPGQPTWWYKDLQGTWDDRHQLSGMIANGDYPFGDISFFGSCPAECELLDGVLLAVNTAKIVDRKVLFDPLFKFHFYDLDFSRQARQAGLKLGTWPIAITHQSVGAVGSASWHEGYQQYLLKWNEAIPPQA